ncbi:TRAP transporter small permease subunit [uncultured Cohaesibacter sp.]|uniref:TRAP transporter small permease subunit n=1 Tax=uncultured Cohaesibacter sp. TaxID=1002546 RepID=UPI0029C933E8|nr:TRAP transporter small permease subunit [uncultured Cohaesibacter sp.]
MSIDSNTPASPEPAGVDGEIRTSLDGAIDWCGRGLAWLVFLAMAISVTEVISRYVFDSPTSWVHESTVFMIAIIFALGGPIALARDKHIRVRIIYDTVSEATRKKLDVFNSVVTFLFSVAMSYAAFVLFWRASHNPSGAWQLERSGTSWNPPFPALTKGIILMALTIMAVQSILHVIKAIRALHDNKNSGER